MLPTNQPKRNIVCCTDGSTGAYKAFEVALKEFTGKPDSFYLLHISDCTKTYLPAKYQVPYIVDHHKTLLLSNLPQSRYGIIIEERDSGNFENIKDQVAYECQKLGASYIFLGNFGRKGDKENVYRVGKTALHMSRICKVPLVIVKKFFQRNKNDTKGFNFACCIDGSQKSLETLKIAKDMARNENDKIYAITAIKDDQEYCPEIEEVTEKVAKKAEELGLTVEHFFTEDEENDIGKSLEYYVNSSEKIVYDYVLIGNCGLRAESIRGYFSGRIATYMIQHSYVNPVIIP